jgi:NAD(P)-dependent dehydrogenase (short-subunit alcohol dehydrogenase family)
MEQPIFDLQGRVAVVTGATRGIGRDIAIAMAQAGARVVVTGRTQRDIDDVVRSIGADAFGAVIDVTDVTQIDEAMNDIRDRAGSIDILVNNAGLGANHRAEDITEADWDSMMDVNLKGLFFCCRAAGRIMLEQGRGRIINMSSQAGVVGIRNHAVYSATKGGVNMLTKVLALEWSSRGVNVNAVAPTFVRTPGTAARLDDSDTAADIVARIPIGRVGSTTDVAGAVIYLASPASSLVTGHTLLVDGGWTAQ